MPAFDVTAQGDLDLLGIGEGLARPGMDTRQWVSFGLVEQATQDGETQTVVFDPELGPLVAVTLQPSGISVVCRVAGWVAGNLEAEYYPFVAGDEVIVVVPEGDERAGCTIIGRLNNGIDLWPGAIAGQDSSTNTFSFRRQKVPHITEFAASYMLRSSGTGALLSFTQDGVVTLNDANKNFLSMSAGEVTLQSGDANEMIQFDLTQGIVYIQGGLTTGGILTIGDTSNFFSAGTFSLNTLGNPAIEHATSTEAVLNMLNVLLPILGNVLTVALGAIPAAPTFPGGSPFATAVAGVFTPASVVSMLQAMLGSAAASSIAPFIGSIGPALAAKPGDTTGNFPGVGSPGVLLG